MKMPKLVLLFFLALAACESEYTEPPQQAPTASFPPIPVSYPLTYADSSHADTLFGKPLLDPYRWLEELASEDVRQWIDDQNALTQSYLQKIPFREKLQKRLEEQRQYETYSIPQRYGAYDYFFKKNSEKELPVLCRSKQLGSAEEEVILNPNFFSKDGSIVLGQTAFDPQGRYLAFELKLSQSGWATIKILDLNTRKELPDRLRYVKNGAIAWQGDGFYYCTYAPPASGKGFPDEEFQEVRYHRIGTAPSEDQLIFIDPSRPDLQHRPHTFGNGKFLFLESLDMSGTHSLYFLDLKKDSSLEFSILVQNSPSQFEVVGTRGNSFYLLTNQHAPHFKLLRAYANQPDSAYWETILPEDGELLEDVHIAQNHILALYRHKAQSRLRMFDPDGRFSREIELPEISYIDQIGSTAGQPPFYFRQHSFTQPARIFSLSENAPVPRLLIAGKKPQQRAGLKTKQIFTKDYDGRQISFFLTYAEGIVLDGKHPTLIATPSPDEKPIRYNATQALLLEQNCILAFTNYTLPAFTLQKGNTEDSTTARSQQQIFNAIQTTAEYLQKQRYTEAGKISLYGSFESAMYAAAAMTQRPDLFGTAILQNGMYDMLRYPLLGAPEDFSRRYGLPSREKSFDYLLSYSPLHNVERAAYPAALLFCSFRQKRISPAHTLKFGASLQTAQSSDKPILLYVETKDAPPRDYQAELLSFLFYQWKLSL